MATDLFANRPFTTVISGGTTAPSGGTVETWVVASSALFPAASSGPGTQFHVGDPAQPTEVITVTNVSGTTWTVTRGAESTTPLAHAPNFTIWEVVSAGDLTAFMQNPMTTAGDTVYGGASGAPMRLAAGTSGQMLTSTGAATAWVTPATDWLNAVNYGADPTGAADSTTAIQAALTAAAPGQVVYLPNGVYKTTTPVIIPQGVTLQGPQRNQQSGGGSSNDWGAVLKPAASFSGATFNATAVLIMQEISNSTGAYRQHAANLMIDGTAAPASVDGIAIYGNVAGPSIESVLCQSITGNGFASYADGTNVTDGLYMANCLAQACTGYGFNIGSQDATFLNCHGQSCTLDAWQITGYNARLIACRGDLSRNGFTIIGPSGSSGGGASSGFSDNITLIGCGTQVNAQNGVNILDNYTGGGTPQPSMVIIQGCSFDMDGANAGSGGGGYAGIAVNGLAVVGISNTRVMVDTTGAAGARRSTPSPHRSPRRAAGCRSPSGPAGRAGSARRPRSSTTWRPSVTCRSPPTPSSRWGHMRATSPPRARPHRGRAGWHPATILSARGQTARSSSTGWRTHSHGAACPAAPTR